MGNMDQQHLGNATAEECIILPLLRNILKNPRLTFHKIEASALLAIFLSFFLAVFESCRRWSNNWFFQKVFLAANAAFLSLGTYSIGLMQSLPVKNKMYPIWAVSLLALLCCVDSAAASGLDNRSHLWKMLYQLCLYSGYVLVMSITTISSDIGNIAICVLAAVTFIKGFHRSMALVLPSSLRNMIREIPAYRITQCSFGDPDQERRLIVDDKLDIMVGDRPVVDMGHIASKRRKEGNNSRMVESDIDACEDVCLSLSLSHLLHRRFLGLGSVEQISRTRTDPLVKNYERAFKVVEMELAFLYDILYTSNTFLHYYEAKSASIWAFASVVGICFVGAVAVIPKATMPRHILVVRHTNGDRVITGVILVSLALLQVLQLLRCWTSNWTRVAFARDRVNKILNKTGHLTQGGITEADMIKTVDESWEMRMRAYLLKFNWFDQKKYLWQNKLGQHSVIDESTRETGCLNYCCRLLFSCGFLGRFCAWICSWDALKTMSLNVHRCLGLLGLHYISREVQEMLRGGSGIGSSPLALPPDVKTSIGAFIQDNIRSSEASDWAVSSAENMLPNLFVETLQTFRPSSDSALENEVICVSCILMWHIATCYCELVLQRDGNTIGHRVVDDNKLDHHLVATGLSKYCAYLVASAPRLLSGCSETTKQVYAQVREVASSNKTGEGPSFAAAGEKLRAMDDCDMDDIELGALDEHVGENIYKLGVKLGVHVNLADCKGHLFKELKLVGFRVKEGLSTCFDQWLQLLELI